jgi:hypothetical protein
MPQEGVKDNLAPKMNPLHNIPTLSEGLVQLLLRRSTLRTTLSEEWASSVLSRSSNRRTTSSVATSKSTWRNSKARALLGMVMQKMALRSSHDRSPKGMRWENNRLSMEMTPQWFNWLHMRTLGVETLAAWGSSIATHNSRLSGKTRESHLHLRSILPIFSSSNNNNNKFSL